MNRGDREKLLWVIRALYRAVAAGEEDSVLDLVYDDLGPWLRSGRTAEPALHETREPES